MIFIGGFLNPPEPVHYEGEKLINGAHYGVAHSHGESLCRWSEKLQAFVVMSDYSQLTLSQVSSYWRIEYNEKKGNSSGTPEAT